MIQVFITEVFTAHNEMFDTEQKKNEWHGKGIQHEMEVSGILHKFNAHISQ